MVGVIQDHSSSLERSYLVMSGTSLKTHFTAASNKLHQLTVVFLRLWSRDHFFFVFRLHILGKFLNSCSIEYTDGRRPHIIIEVTIASETAKRKKKIHLKSPLLYSVTADLEKRSKVFILWWAGIIFASVLSIVQHFCNSPSKSNFHHGNFFLHVCSMMEL